MCIAAVGFSHRSDDVQHVDHGHRALGSGAPCACRRILTGNGRAQVFRNFRVNRCWRRARMQRLENVAVVRTICLPRPEHFSESLRHPTTVANMNVELCTASCFQLAAHFCVRRPVGAEFLVLGDLALSADEHDDVHEAVWCVAAFAAWTGAEVQEHRVASAGVRIRADVYSFLYWVGFAAAESTKVPSGHSTFPWPVTRIGDFDERSKLAS